MLYGSADAVATELLAGLGLPVTITGADDVSRLGAKAPAEQLAQPFGVAEELVQALVAMAWAQAKFTDDLAGSRHPLAP